MGQGKEGDTICLLINGTDYKDIMDSSIENDDIAIKYCDDDHYKFCNNSLATAYLWDMLN